MGDSTLELLCWSPETVTTSSVRGDAGCAVQQDAAAEEEAIPGRRTRRPRRRGRGGAREDNGAADGDGAHSQEPAQPNGVAGEQQTFSNPIFADDEAPETLDADATGRDCSQTTVDHPLYVSLSGSAIQSAGASNETLHESNGVPGRCWCGG